MVGKGWEPHVEHVDFEARALVRRLQPAERQVLSALCDTPDAAVPTAELARRLDQPAEMVDAAVARVNQFAEALGHRPLIETAVAGLVVPLQYVTVARDALINARTE